MIFAPSGYELAMRSLSSPRVLRLHKLRRKEGDKGSGRNSGGTVHNSGSKEAPPPPDCMVLTRLMRGQIGNCSRMYSK